MSEIETVSARPSDANEEEVWGGQDYPRPGDYFHYITRKLTIREDFHNSQPHNKEYCSCGNCFKTHELAQERLDLIKIYFTPIDIP